jgi:hypothetical protein
MWVAMRRAVWGMCATCLTAGAAVALSPLPAAAQSVDVGAQAVVLSTQAAPTAAKRTITEGYVAQPVIMAHAAAWRDRLTFIGTLNLEGLTLRRGELNTGIYGEGYIDRRHPHTFVHEAVVSIQSAPAMRARARVSLSAGRGFAPFGTDDPMMRPFAAYPVNHHLAQILERLVVIGAVRAPGLLLEGATFNGDEPTGPWAWPRASRFGDSWSARATAIPFELTRRRLPGAAELSASIAHVASPENPFGGMLDQRKYSLAARWTRGAPLGAAGVGDRRDGDYAFAEWARTDARHATGPVRSNAFRYSSALAELGSRRRGVEIALRAERSSRPEEERLLNIFRSPRPESDNSILGVTEWRILTGTLGTQLALGRGAAALRLAPFVEASRLVPHEVIRPSVFQPPAFYGASTLWQYSAGVRLALGASHSRMGRYGVAADHAHDSRATSDDEMQHATHEPDGR